MLDALYIAAVGLQAQKEQLDVSANNFANMSTPGFKRQSVDFSAILNRAPTRGVEAVTAPDAHPGRLLRADMTPGVVQATGRPLDIAIAGPGFFEVELPDGQIGYSRGGSLQVNAEGGLSLPGGLALKTDLRIPSSATVIRIEADGSVTANLSRDSTPTLLGQLELVTPASPETLQYRGDGVFTAADGTADPTRGRPGDNGTSALAPQSLEASNVGITDEIVALTLTGRIYELNSRVVQAADEMMSMANNLRRS